MPWGRVNYENIHLWHNYYEVVTLPNATVVTDFLRNNNIMLGGGRFGDRLMVSVSVNCFKDPFSVLLRSQHYSMLTVRHRNHTVIIIMVVTVTFVKQA